MLTRANMISFVATADPDASRRFYEDVLGLRLIADEPSALVFDGGGTILRVSKVNELSPAPYTVLGWEVEDVQARARDLAEREIEPERFEGLPQNEHGVCAFPDGSRVVWFKDPDGNLLSFSQFPETAPLTDEPPPTIA